MLNVWMMLPLLALTACVTGDALSWSPTQPPAIRYEADLNFMFWPGQHTFLQQECRRWTVPFSPGTDVWVSAIRMSGLKPGGGLALWRPSPGAPLCVGPPDPSWTKVASFDVPTCLTPSGTAFHLNGGEELMLVISPALTGPTQAHLQLDFDLVEDATSCDPTSGCACNSVPATTKQLDGAVFVPDVLQFVDGVTLAVDGYPDNQAVSVTNGKFELAIPEAALGKPGAILATGQGHGVPVLPTHYYFGPGPSGALLDGSEANHNLAVRAFFDGIRSALGRQLAAHGDIPAADGASGAAFGLRWNWAWILLAGTDPSTGGRLSYAGGTLHVAGDGGQCKVFYTQGYVVEGLTVGDYIDFQATSTANSEAVVVCPASQLAPVELSLTGPVTDTSGHQAAFTPFTVPMAHGEAVSVDWFPSPAACSPANPCD
jgi:hypothetical protein